MYLEVNRSRIINYKIYRYLICMLLGGWGLVSDPSVWSQSKNPVVQPRASCSDLGLENGWSAWQSKEGYHAFGTAAPIFFSASTPSAPRFNITSGNGVDPCTVGAGGPPLPVVAPGFGNFSLQLGQPGTNGMQPGTCTNNPPYPGPASSAVGGNGCSEQATFPLTVTAQDTNFIFAYAMVVENPANGHTADEAPFAEIYILDSKGDTIPCSHRKYVADLNGGVGPGFYAASCAGSVNPPPFPANGMIVSYKPWTIEGINLSAYIGQNITVVLTNSDCSKGGHYCYSYWDFLCGTLPTTPASYCIGQPVTISAPSGSLVNYTYQWFQNGLPYTGSGANSATIIPNPQPGDTFSVQLLQPSGCGFFLNYVPQPLSITPQITSTSAGSCSSGSASFSDASTTSDGTPVVSWNWSFPGGTPSSSTAQNPSNIQFPPGNYTVTLVVTSQQGCTDTISLPVTVGGGLPPTAAFNSNPPCLGSSTQLQDGSVSAQNDPIVTWNWSMPGGSPAQSGSQNPSTVYTTAGTHSVTLVITTQQGCKDTLVQQVLVYHPPVASFSGPASGCVPVCNNYLDGSTSIDGNVVSWAWSFPGGAPSSSSQQNPVVICYNTAGTYSASLVITSSYGCKDTLILPVVQAFPWPKAEFCVSPAQAPVTAPDFNFCDMWTKDVVQWYWDFGDGTTDSVQTDPAHSYSATAFGNDFYSYNVCLNVQNQYGCWDSVCHPVELIPEFTFYIPNCFTPNGDFINEYFFGKSRGVKEYNIWIFDRWGNLIWDCHREEKNTNWDMPGKEGLSSGCQWSGEVENQGMDLNGNSRQLVQEDVYVWKVQLIDIFDKKHTYVGHVSAVR